MATPETFRPLHIAPHLRPLPSAGITRLQRYYGPLRHPAGPTSTSRAVGWRVPRHQTGLPVLSLSKGALILLFHACCRQYPGETRRCVCRSLPDRWQPSPFSRRVGFRIERFGACSAFTHVAARMVAKPPLAARYVEVLQTTSLPSSPAPTATGWSDSCRAGFAPAVEWRLSTAHEKTALSPCHSGESRGPEAFGGRRIPGQARNDALGVGITTSRHGNIYLSVMADTVSRSPDSQPIASTRSC